jgi:hypothetical protein
MVQKSWEDKPHPWRAVCIERCMHGSERGSWKRGLMVHVRSARWLSTLPDWSLVRPQLGPPVSLQASPQADLRQASAHSATRKLVKKAASDQSGQKRMNNQVRNLMTKHLPVL